jgi:hypothetical protein
VTATPLPATGGNDGTQGTTKANGADAPAPEYLFLEIMAQAVMELLEALGKAIEAQRRIERLAGPRPIESLRAMERAARAEAAR